MSDSSRRLSQAEPPDTRLRAPSLGGLGLGQAVEVQGSRGIVRFSGTTSFAPGRWYGVELEEPLGKNDGSVLGQRYFECAPGHGVFVRSSQIKILASSGGAAEAVRSRTTIHGTEIQQQQVLPDNRIRPPGSGLPPGPGTDALRAARRATALPGRIAPPGSQPSPASASSSAAPPFSLGGALAQRPAGSQLPRATSPAASALPGAGLQTRQLSNVHGRAARRGTLSGAVSPAPSGTRSGSRQARASDNESAASRPLSREQPPPRMRMETPSPTEAQTPGSSELFQTPTKEPRAAAAGAAEAAEGTPRTPYRPALSMEESSALDAPAGTATMNSQSVPLRQYEELRLKYKFLEQKRSEDRQRLQEADKIRADAEQALRVRDKLAAKVGAQQDEARTLKQKLKESVAEREDLEAKYTEALDSMEILAVDKEMAEEKAEALAQEVGALREQLDETSTDLSVFRQDGGRSGAASGPSEALEYTQLQKQNERLKEALVRLRDVSAENEAGLSQRVKQLEREAQTAQELADENCALKEAHAAAELQVEDLKERLDDALGAEEMIESLTERNLDLSSKVEELQSVVENLEALCEVNNEMEETRAEEEQGLRAEIERLAAVANDKTRRIDRLEEALADFQFNVKQYRELVATLQGDLQQLREREASQASEAATVSSKTQEMLSLNLQLRSTMMKTKAKAIDLELRRLEAEQAAEQLAMTEPFLPDHFFSGESEALCTLLALRRLAAKSGILCKQLEQDEATDAGVSDDFVAAADIRALLTQFSGAASLLVAFLSACSDSEFLRLGPLLHDAQSMERRLNGLVDLVRTEEFRAADSLPEVRRLTAQARALAHSHVPANAPATAAQRLDAMAARLAFGTDVQLANLFYTEQLLAVGPAPAEGGAAGPEFPAADRQRIDREVLPSVASVIQNCKAAKPVAIKLLRRAKDLARAGMAADGRVFEQAGRLVQTCDDLCEYSIRVRAAIQGHFAVAAGGESGERTAPSLAVLQRDLAAIAQDVFGAGEAAAAFGPALAASQRLTKELAAALTALSDDGSTSKSAAADAEAPWARRAARFKASLVQNADVEKRTKALNEEIISLARELKLRDQTIQEFSVKAEMLEKRAEAMRKQAEPVGELQRLLEGARAKEQTYEEAIESLQGEMDGLESECRKLRQAGAAARASEAAGAGAGMGAGAGAPMPTDLLGLRNKIATLQDSAAYLRRENAHLRAKYLYRDELQQLAEHPLVRVAPPSAAAAGDAVREAKAVAMEARRLAAAPRLVRLVPAQGRPATAWRPLASQPGFELYRQQALAQTLQQRAGDIHERLRAIPRFPVPMAGA
ncbi:hypothetical protein LPJ61_003000 [Coemansia biformis]|uniref:CAP-Gly domain-containing protein n=1 Tax=Coemansia biformis TaxID=1286918 RepID=A0A9W8CVY0_9FUNG|nr:hypothetical protein LPJ61_003000 [Coemansia biformis]